MFLKGDIIYLRGLEPEDVELLYRWENNPEVWSISQTLKPFSKYTLKMFVDCASDDIYATRQLRMMMNDLNTRATIGIIDIFDFDPFNSRVGVGILVDKKSRNKGVGTDAIRLIKKYVFEVLMLHQIYCHILTDNQISLALFQHAGFSVIGIKKEWIKTSSGYKDAYLLQMINPS